MPLSQAIAFDIALGRGQGRMTSHQLNVLVRSTNPRNPPDSVRDERPAKAMAVDSKEPCSRLPVGEFVDNGVGRGPTATSSG